jgi:coenzyme PQQ precursor peptide PqqA
MVVAFNHTIRSIVMKWETPQATDFRFGMEITMYIAKR